MGFSFKMARIVSKNFPERFRLKANVLRGDDKNPPLFIWKLQERKELSENWIDVCGNGFFGMIGRSNGRIIHEGIGEFISA